MNASLLLIIAIGLLFAFTLRLDATIKLGGGVTGIRGSIGGTTFSHNAGGDYIRNRTKPINPRSPLQNTRRAFLARCAKAWSNELEPQERTDWLAYAKGTTWKNRLGDEIGINGLAALVRVNTLLAMGGEAFRTAAPTKTGHAGGLTFSFKAESDNTVIQINKPAAPFDESTPGHMVYFFMGHPTEIGRICTPKGFRYIGRVYGHDTPLEYPVALDAAYTMTEGQFITIRAMWHDEDFRVSGPWWATAEAAPSG